MADADIFCINPETGELRLWDHYALVDRKIPDGWMTWDDFAAKVRRAVERGEEIRVAWMTPHVDPPDLELGGTPFGI